MVFVPFHEEGNTTISPQQHRIHYLDALRIIAICAIVLLHVAGSYWYELPVDGSDWNVVNVYDCITRWGVPLFVMISGALFLDPDRPQPLRKIWCKNILHIVVLIVVWGFIYALLYHRPESFTPDALASFLKESLFGPQHLWFLFMLIGLYILVPILRAVTANETALTTFVVLGIVVNIVLPLCFLWDALSVVEDLYQMLLIQMPLGYSFCFVLGYYLASHDLPRWSRILIYLLGIVGLIAACVSTSVVSNEGGSVDPVFISRSCFFIPAAAALFILFRQLFSKHDFSEETLSLLYQCSSCTLGVYVVHIIVLKTFFMFGMSAVAIDPLVGVPSMALAAIVVSFVLTWILKCIPYVNRIV